MASDARQDKAQPMTKAERAYHELRRLIANGTIRPGTVFDQEQLARDLKMSTTPLRETLRRLESEGFVQLSPHRDVHVRQLSAQEMRDLYQVRIVLEPHAARLSALSASDADITALQREIERSPTRAPDLAEHYQKVHQLLYAGCGNRFLVAVLDRVNDRIGRYRAMFVPLDANMLELIGRFHSRASAAFAARDGDLVATVVRDHLERAMHGFGEIANFQHDNVGAAAEGGWSTVSMLGAFQGFDTDIAPTLSKVDVAYRAVKRWILEGTLPPGSQIDQHMIADRISLSTTPVREALRRLEVEGFVILVARHAARVRELDPAELDDLLDVRLQLEPVAAGFAVSHAPLAERSRAVELARLIGTSPLEQQHINRQFHRCIYASCGNEIMTQTLDAVYDHCDRYSLQLLEDPADYVQSVSEDHALLAQAYVDRDSDAMRELMASHLTHSRSLLCSKAQGLAEHDRHGGKGAWVVDEEST